MNKMIFEFDEQMMTICLLANGWTAGWKTQQWVRPGETEEAFGGFSIKEAFTRLLLDANVYSHSFDNGWKLK